MKKKFVPPHLMNGRLRRCILMDCTVRVCPVASVHIDTPYYKGQVEAVCMPDAICDLVIGNVDGVKSAGLTDVSRPINECSTEGNINPGNPFLDPFCNLDVNGDDLTGAVVTKMQSKKKKLFRPLKVHHSEQCDPSSDRPLTREEQESDESLKCYLDHNKGRINATFNLQLYKNIWHRVIIVNGVECKQVLVPKNRRKTILSLAHECLFGGHMGAKKTGDRVLSCFYWPGVSGDIKNWCKTCDVCQRTIAKGRISKIPLGKVPLMNTPFQKIAIDLVGPISPCSGKGNRYILTVVDYATRWPEAVALPDITTERIAESLLDIFSRLGFPQEILSDQGSQFTSGLMKEICRLISIKQSFTTPYHPMANGLNERFNGTLKAMLKRICQERPKDWDRYLPAILFAYREVPQSSTGFSPFELLYGRTVRGPLTLIRDVWIGNDQGEVYNTYQYVSNLKNKLEETCQLVHENALEAGEKYKHYYDKKARVRYMKVGDKVLVLLPTDSNKLLLSWKGPFEITEVLNDFDYRVELAAGKTKVFHANLLKLYEVRDEVMAVSVITYREVDEDEPLIPLPEVKGEGETYNDVSINPDLSSSQKTELKRLIEEYKVIFSDRPGLTNLEEHVINLADKVPVREKQYPIPFSTKAAIEDEVQSMLKEGIIERSHSDYSAPVVLVKKPDGTHRFCINYRKLNMKTKFDAEPMNQPDDILANLATKKVLFEIRFH